MSVLIQSREDDVVRLTLNRPDAGNALDLELARALRDSAGELSADASCAVVLIDGEGPLFCGGGDVAAMSRARSPEEYVRDLADTVHEALLRFATSDKVIVSAVNGTVAGGGLGIVLSSDYVVAAADASFVSAYSKVGLSPDCGSSYLLPRIVGPTRATELVLFGRVLDASTALDWGMINAVVPAGELALTTRRAAQDAARVPAAARVASKRLLAAGWLPGYGPHLRNEREQIAALAATVESAQLRAKFVYRTRP